MLSGTGAAGSGGSVRIADQTAAPELVWSHAASACTDSDYADVPVRPFFGTDASHHDPTLYWFASNATGYLATIGVPPEPGSDILARMERIVGPDGSCRRWVSAGPYTEPPVAPANGIPETYNTDLWMEAPFTPDGRQIFALVHNEFHGELTAPPGKPSKYCTITQAAPPPKYACGYWNIAAARSDDGAQHFHLVKAPGSTLANAPVFASPYPYLLPADNGGTNPPQSGMAAQSNIIRWDHFYYVLVLQLPSPAPPPQAGQPQAIGANGTCLYRTDDLADPTSWRGWGGAGFTVPVIGQYPAKLADPAKYVCTPVISGMYRFSWSYNTVLHQFILLGIDTNFGGKGGEAFVYTTAVLQAGGRLQQTSGVHLLRAINWLDRWTADPTLTGEAYPSLLDPTSPLIADRSIPDPTPGDLNFQYSAARPYLYFTLLHPIEGSPDHTNRDVVRQRLLVTADDAPPE